MNKPLRGQGHRRTTVLVVGVALCVAGGGAVVAGFAASLGPLSSKSLGAWSTALAAGAPSVAVCDNFEGADGTLQGRAVSTAAHCGVETWDVDHGSWSVVSGTAQSDGTTDAVATVGTALSDATVDVTIVGVDAASQRGGLVLDHDGIGTYLAAVIVGDATSHVDLVLVNGGVPTTLSSADVTIGPVATLSLTRDGSTVTVLVDGSTIIEHTLGPGDIATLGSGTRAGLYASNTSAQFDNLRVTSPSPG
jgi:hypothetical protein